MDTNCNGCASPPPPTPPGALPTEFAVEGMTCSNCARHVTEAIQAVPGVAGVTVTLETGRARVRWASNAMADVAAVLAAVDRAGFKARALERVSGDSASTERAPGGWQTNLWLGGAGTAPLLVGEWVLGLGHQTAFRWLSFVLATVVQVFAGARFYRGAWRQLQARSANMDTLVALGSTTAYLFSVGVLVSGSGQHLYFMEAAAIITLISVGHWLEARMSARATGALKRLLHLAPPQARRRHADGSETLVPVAQVKVGDHIVLRPGDRVPTDGRVVEGNSAVDESMLTGEAVPVDKTAGALVYAGTVNLNGRLVVETTATGEATALAHIIAAVQRAQQSRARIQRLGDRVSSVFVPVVVLIAIGTALGWLLAPQELSGLSAWLAERLGAARGPTSGLAAALVHAAAVLIVACPCAMGLATPVAIMAGTNAAAARGILVRDGLALEKAGRITSVVFDKTGTLTTGQPVVARFATYVGGDRPRVHEMKVAAAMARHSSHPFSRAIAQLHTDELPLFNWEEVRGCGLQCYVHVSEPKPRLVLARLGSLQWLKESGVDLACGADFINEWTGQGATILGMAVDHSLLGLIALQDAIKADAADVIAELKGRGYRVRLLTGDNERTARAVGGRVGIRPEDVLAEVHPEQKAEILKQLQARGERVAFVGDGINDAPALEQADLGIAVSRASDVALEAADLILLRSDLPAVPEGLGLARATLRTIKQNLFWAFFYNALGIPLAALGLLSPVLCALAMGASDLIVIGNALRLQHWKLLTWRIWRRRLVRQFDSEVLHSA